MTAHPSARPLAKEVLDHLRDGVLLIAGDRVIAASARASELLELPQSRLLGAAASELLPSQLGNALERLKLGASSVTLRGVPWNGPGPLAEVTLSVTAGPEPDQVIVQLRDESDPSGQAAAEDFRRRLTWLDSMAAGIAHEIRNPLGGIRGAAQLLQRTPGEAELTELTELIIQESDRINSLVEQLMQFTRPRRLERSDVDINGLVQDEVALLRAQFGSEDVEWDLDLDPSLPKVEGDRLRLREAVGNLLRNARQAAASKIAVRTRIETGKRLTEAGFDRGQSLHLEVRDDGPGIPHSETASIFAPFSTNKPQGTGLGLFVTRQIVDDHGARLTLDPGHGKGALFRLTLTERLMPKPEALEGIPRAFQLGLTTSSSSLAVESSR